LFREVELWDVEVESAPQVAASCLVPET